MALRAGFAARLCCQRLFQLSNSPFQGIDASGRGLDFLPSLQPLRLLAMDRHRRTSPMIPDFPRGSARCRRSTRASRAVRPSRCLPTRHSSLEAPLVARRSSRRHPHFTDFVRRPPHLSIRRTRRRCLGRHSPERLLVRVCRRWTNRTPSSPVCGRCLVAAPIRILSVSPVVSRQRRTTKSRLLRLRRPARVAAVRQIRPRSRLQAATIE